MPDQVLRTARLALEPLEAGHAALLLDVLSAPEIYEHLEMVADRLDDVANQVNGIVLESV